MQHRKFLWVQHKLQSFVPWLCYLSWRHLDNLADWVWSKKEDYVYFNDADGFEMWVDPDYGFHAEMQRWMQEGESDD